MIELEVQRACEEAETPTDAQLQAWVEHALQGRRTQAELTLRMVDETEGAQLNHDYRGRDYATNVLSFPFEAPAEVAQDYLGDLAVCAAVVAREAAEQGKPLEAHWAHMVVHGVLHLLGYDHQQDASAEQMETIEIQLLSALGYADPYKAP